MNEVQENDYRHLMKISEWKKATDVIDWMIDSGEIDTTYLYYDRGQCCEELELWEDALLDYSVYLSRRENNIAALDRRIEVLRKLGRFAEALEDHNRIISIDGYSFNVRRKLDTLMMMGNYEQAIAESTDYIALHPRNANVYISRAEAHFGIKNFQAAINDYTTAWKYQKKNPYALLRRALVKENLGDTEGAISDYDKACGLRGGTYYGMINKARIFLQMKRFRDAILTANPAIRMKRRGDDYSLRADCWFELCEFAKAEADYSTAIMKIPYNLHYRYNRAVCRFYLKKYTAALDDAQYVLSLDPEYGDAEVLRDDILSRL